MAILFTATSSQYLLGSLSVSSSPLTMACWYYPNNLAAYGVLACIGDISSEVSWHWLAHRGDLANDPVDAWSRSSVRDGHAYSTAGASGASGWYHATAVFETATSRAAYFNGGNVGTDTTNVNPTGLDTLGVSVTADASPSGYFYGMIAGLTVWDAALTATEVAALATGIPAWYIRPVSIVAHIPMLRTYQDLFGGVALTAYNSPTWADHPPRVWYPVPTVGFWLAGGAPPAVTIPPMMQHYRQLRS